MTAEKRLIVNADDLGLSSGVDDGIVEAHVRGIVTSTSLMVAGPTAAEAVSMIRDHPDLSVGLHWVGDGPDQRELDLEDPAAVRDGFLRQLDAFVSLVGREPTHVDSHHHVHRAEPLIALFQELVAPLAVPLRGDGRVAHVGGFYAQWEWKVTDLEHVSVEFLQWLLREEVGEGWTELSCHPATRTDDLRSVYASEREAELKTLTDPRVAATAAELGIELVNYEDWARADVEGERTRGR
jgi:predicted glycoside hydrolase/deacetylase ChbG (UPF0249 family)